MASCSLGRFRSTCTVFGGTGKSVGVSLTAPAPPAPAKPAGFSAAEGNARATLSWTDPGDFSVTKHQYRRKAGRGAWGAWTDVPNSASGGANADSWTVTNLMNGVVYAFQLRAVNAGGPGPASAQARATPVPPTIVWSSTLTVNKSYYGGYFGCSTATIFAENCRDRLADNDFTYRGEAYRVLETRWWQTDGKFYFRVADHPAWAARYAFAGLTLHVGDNKFAISRAGTSTSGQSLTWPMAQPGLERRAEGFAVARDGHEAGEEAGALLGGGGGRPGHALLGSSPRRTAQKDPDHDFTITGHQYRQEGRRRGLGRLDGHPGQRASAATSNVASHTVTGLRNGVSYAFQVRAVNDAGPGPASDAATAVTPATQNTLWSATLTADPYR